uniref:Uncharacterized protein n=1 Tax=Solanum tuberosum TaxID=4113 RepID=M1DYP7_SOLTU
MDMIVLGFDKGLPVKVPPMLLLDSTKIGRLTLKLKEEMVGDIHYLLVLNKGFANTYAKGREGRKAPPSGSGPSSPKKNIFYALQTRQEQEGFPDVVTGVLKVFHLDVYAFFDPALKAKEQGKDTTGQKGNNKPKEWRRAILVIAKTTRRSAEWPASPSNFTVHHV